MMFVDWTKSEAYRSLLYTHVNVNSKNLVEVLLIRLEKILNTSYYNRHILNYITIVFT